MSIHCCVAPVLSFNLYSTLSLCMFGTWMSRGLLACLWICKHWASTVLSTHSLGSLWSACLVGKKRHMHRENYNSEEIYLQVYWLCTKYIHECYLAEPGVRCSSHTSQSSIYLLVGKWWAFSLVAFVWVWIHRNWNQEQDTQEQDTQEQAVSPL